MKVVISETTARGLEVACDWAEEAWEDFVHRARNHQSNGYTREDVQRAATNVRAWREARHALDRARGVVKPAPIVEPSLGEWVDSLPADDDPPPVDVEARLAPYSVHPDDDVTRVDVDGVTVAVTRRIS